MSDKVESASAFYSERKGGARQGAQRRYEVVRDSSIQEFLCLQKKAKHGKILYHYTSPAAFLSIMDASRRNERGGEFLCTNFHFLNDDEEFCEGIEWALRWMRKERVDGLGEKEIRDIERLLRNPTKDEKDTHDWLSVPWVLSFSEASDSTAQWMAYTDRTQGGVALGVDRNRIFEFAKVLDRNLQSIDCEGDCDNKNDLPLRETGGVFLAPCLYYDKRSGKRDEYFKRLEYVFSHDESYYVLKTRIVAPIFGNVHGRL